MVQPPGQHLNERRKSHRLKVQIPVDVLYGSRSHTLGEVVNLSRDGAAVDAQLPLTVGQLYRFHLHGFGTWPGVIIRRFGDIRHGVRFEIDEDQKCRVDEVIQSISGGTEANRN